MTKLVSSFFPYVGKLLLENISWQVLILGSVGKIYPPSPLYWKKKWFLPRFQGFFRVFSGFCHALAVKPQATIGGKLVQLPLVHSNWLAESTPPLPTC